jgi:hypothetical protein
VNTAIQSDSPAAPGPQDDRENHVLAGTRSVGRFRNGQAVRVIRATNFPSKRTVKVLVKRPSVQPCGVRVFYQAGVCGDGSGNSHAHRCISPEFSLDSFYTAGNGAHRTFIVKARSGNPVTMPFPAVSVERHEFNLCATKIDSDSNAL